MHFTPLLLVAPALCVVAFIVLPLLAIFLKVLPQPSLLDTLSEPLVTAALHLSLLTSLTSLLIAVLFGTPIAYLLARYRFRGVRLIETLIDLPMVLPPTVVGYYLLVAFGGASPLGQAYAAMFGHGLVFTFEGLLVFLLWKGAVGATPRLAEGVQP